MLFVVVLYGPVLMLTVLIHEFGHVFATKRLGGEVGGVVLWVSRFEFSCFVTSIVHDCVDALSTVVSPISHIHDTFIDTISTSPLADSHYADQPIASQEK